MKTIPSLLALVLCCAACGTKDEKPLPGIAFDKTKWNVKDTAGNNYVYRKQMVNDLLNNHRWVGMRKDSLVQVLGYPDAVEEGGFMYDYDRKPFLFGTAIEAVVFEITPDSTVKAVRLNDGGWD